MWHPRGGSRVVEGTERAHAFLQGKILYIIFRQIQNISTNWEDLLLLQTQRV